MSRRNVVKRAKTRRKRRLEMDALWERIIKDWFRREGLEDKWILLEDPWTGVAERFAEVRG